MRRGAKILRIFLNGNHRATQKPATQLKSSSRRSGCPGLVLARIPAWPWSLVTALITSKALLSKEARCHNYILLISGLTLDTTSSRKPPWIAKPRLSISSMNVHSLLYFTYHGTHWYLLVCLFLLDHGFFEGRDCES